MTFRPTPSPVLAGETAPPSGSPADARPPTAFPFSAVVGNDDAKLALLLAALDPRLGGVLLRGDKGTAKTTLARGLAALLPGDAPFVELPLGATEDRVTGSIDLGAVLTDGGRRFEPGVLAAADGGVLYVDEINLLADHLVDVVLDAAASGRNRIERDGISHEHSARFVLVGSMNPEEGELRPQLLDRFGLMIDVTTPREPEVRVEAVDRRMAFDDDPIGLATRWSQSEADLQRRLADTSPARVEPELRLTIARLCASLGVEGLRADLMMTRAAAALAAWEQRDEACEDDVLRVAPFVLAHRRRRGPLDEPGIDPEMLDDAWDDATDGRRDETPDGRKTTCNDNTPHADGTAEDPGVHGDGREEHAPDDAGDSNSDHHGDGGADHPPVTESATDAAGTAAPSSVVPIGASRAIGDTTVGAPSAAASTQPGTTASSAVASAPGGARRGRQIADRAPQGRVASVAVHASVAATAARRAQDPGAAPVIREAVHEQIRGRLVVLCVDASGSMNASTRMEAAKGAALGLLTSAYQRRDQVAMVTFGGDGAAVALRPTSSVEVARRRLAELPSGGTTPLADGLRTAHELIVRTGAPSDAVLVVMSDGRASSAPDGLNPLEAAYAEAGDIARAGIQSLVVDADTSAVPLGLAAELARHLGASVAPLSTDADAIARTLLSSTP